MGRRHQETNQHMAHLRALSNRRRQPPPSNTASTLARLGSLLPGARSAVRPPSVPASRSPARSPHRKPPCPIPADGSISAPLCLFRHVSRADDIERDERRLHRARASPTYEYKVAHTHTLALLARKPSKENEKVKRSSMGKEGARARGKGAGGRRRQAARSVRATAAGSGVDIEGGHRHRHQQPPSPSRRTRTLRTAKDRPNQPTDQPTRHRAETAVWTKALLLRPLR